MVESVGAMAKWVEVGTAAELQPGQRVCVTMEGRSLAVFNLDGALVAIANVCPHAGMPLAEGELRGTVLTCPYHGYTYNLKTGKNVDYADDEPVHKYAVRDR